METEPKDFFPPVNICRLSDDQCKNNKNMNIIPGPIMVDTRPVSSRCSGFNFKTNKDNVYVCASETLSGGHNYDYGSIVGIESKLQRLGCYLNACDNRPTFPDGLESHPQEGLVGWVESKNMKKMGMEGIASMTFNESTKRKIVLGRMQKPAC